MSDLTYPQGAGFRAAVQRMVRSAVWKVPSIESPDSVPSRCQTARGATRSKEIRLPAVRKFESPVAFPRMPT